MWRILNSMRLALSRTAPRTARRRRPPAFCRPSIECLEDRDVPSNTVLTVSPNPAAVGQGITLTATITQSGGDDLVPGTGNPPGTVTFYDGSTMLGSSSVSQVLGMPQKEGAAQLTISAGLAPGMHSLTAQYSGEAATMIVTLQTSGSTSLPVPEVVNAPSQGSLPAGSSSAPASLAIVLPTAPARHHHTSPLARHFTVVNRSGSAIEGPLFVVLRGLNRHVRLKGSSTTPSGSRFVPLTASGLAPGQEVSLTLSFSNPRGARISFTAEVVDSKGLL
jgi:hypothetical protein